VGITAGSREVPGRNACDRRHAYCIIIIIIIITAIGLSPGGNGYFTCLQNMKLVANKFSREGYMRSLLWHLGILGTISAFAYRHRETKKNLCRGGQLQDLLNTDF